MRISTKVSVNLRGLLRFRGALAFRSGKVGEAFNEWVDLYADFTLVRFLKFSGGGGNWRRLATSTLAARRSRGNSSSLILQDRGLLREQLQTIAATSTGVRSTSTPFGIKVDFSGNARYKNGTSVSTVIALHNKGAGNLPRRQIFVQPDRATKKKMARVMEKALGDEARA